MIKKKLLAVLSLTLAVSSCSFLYELLPVEGGYYFGNVYILEEDGSLKDAQNTSISLPPDGGEIILKIVTHSYSLSWDEIDVSEGIDAVIIDGYKEFEYEDGEFSFNGYIQSASIKANRNNTNRRRRARYYIVASGPGGDAALFTIRQNNITQ